MFAWLKRLFSRSDKNSWNVYSLKERMLYQYFDGEKDVKADPMIIYKKLKENWNELSVDIKLYNSAHKDSPQGYEAMIQKIKKIFDVKELQEGGLSRPEMEALLYHFMEYCNRVKKNSNLTPTYATETSPSTASTPVAAQPTPSTSGSGSTETAPPTGEASPSPSA